MNTLKYLNYAYDLCYDNICLVIQHYLMPFQSCAKFPAHPVISQTGSVKEIAKAEKNALNADGLSIKAIPECLSYSNLVVWSCIMPLYLGKLYKSLPWRRTAARLLDGSQTKY